jgi:glycosidase
MKKPLFILLLLWLSLSVKALEISRMEPPFWWTGMKNTELQILVYGKDIARSELQFDYPCVRLKHVVRTDNPNYLFVYLDIGKDAKAGVVQFNFTEGKKKLTKTFELKPRATTAGAQGFDPSDVMYLIMPDRFANGDPSNDVWDGEAIDRNEPFARHGGDLAGINAHLDYFEDLGVTTLWLNPVLENKMNSPEKYKSYHGYAITDFYAVDKRLGTNEEYRLLIENTHKRGMKMVMDMIFNHCGSLHWWMNDFPCKDWLNHQTGFVPTTHNLYTVMDVHAPPSEIAAMTDGWFVTSMPDLNQRNTLLADYLIQNSIWWIEYSRIDGIRHDTHPYVDFDFLARWSKAINDEYPDFNLVGEVWYMGGAAPLAWWQRNSKVNSRQSHLKTIMDFNLMTAYNRAFDIRSPENNPWKSVYEIIAQDFVYEDLKNILIFLDNHDTSRFMKEEETALDRYRQALAFLLTTRGIPQLYYGTEILMTGEKKDGDGNLRKDFPGGWRDDPINAFTAAGRTDLQNEAFDYLRKLLQWRKTNAAVTGGQLIHYAPDRTQCYVYARIRDNNRVLVILNGSGSEQTLSPEKYREVLGDAVSGKDIISDKTVNLKEKLVIPAKGVSIIEIK